MLCSQLDRRYIDSTEFVEINCVRKIHNYLGLVIEKQNGGPQKYHADQLTHLQWKCKGPFLSVQLLGHPGPSSSSGSALM